jgi:hypothetical protein
VHGYNVIIELSLCHGNTTDPVQYDVYQGPRDFCHEQVSCKSNRSWIQVETPFLSLLKPSW